jgi:hypothetical protein
MIATGKRIIRGVLAGVLLCVLSGCEPEKVVRDDATVYRPPLHGVWLCTALFSAAVPVWLGLGVVWLLRNRQRTPANRDGGASFYLIVLLILLLCVWGSCQGFFDHVTIDDDQVEVRRPFEHRTFRFDELQAVCRVLEQNNRGERRLYLLFRGDGSGIQAVSWSEEYIFGEEAARDIVSRARAHGVLILDDETPAGGEGGR